MNWTNDEVRTAVRGALRSRQGMAALEEIVEAEETAGDAVWAEDNVVALVLDRLYAMRKSTPTEAA